MAYLRSEMSGASAGRIGSRGCSNLKAYSLTWLMPGGLVGIVGQNTHIGGWIFPHKMVVGFQG